MESVVYLSLELGLGWTEGGLELELGPGSGSARARLGPGIGRGGVGYASAGRVC